LANKPPTTGILLVNLGTPNSTSPRDLRRYLKEFLSDPRVVEVPRAIWWLILNGFILTTRPKKSAALYEKIWTENGSPLLCHSQNLARQLQAVLGATYKVVLAMRYGDPSIANGLAQLKNAGIDRILVLPLYPQYSATTTASTFDAVTQELQQWRQIPELRFINRYHNDTGYIEAIADSIRDFRSTRDEVDRLLISFHGIPQDYADAGDPYPNECQISARMIAEKLGLADEQWAMTFQSRIGRKPWLQPYTDETLKRWANEGIKRVQVICPGFPVDCLETLEEVGKENRDYFLQAGGESYEYIPALNTSDQHIQLLKNLVFQHKWRA